MSRRCHLISPVRQYRRIGRDRSPIRLLERRADDRRAMRRSAGSSPWCGSTTGSPTVFNHACALVSTAITIRRLMLPRPSMWRARKLVRQDVQGTADRWRRYTHSVGQALAPKSFRITVARSGILSCQTETDQSDMTEGGWRGFQSSVYDNVLYQAKSSANPLTNNLRDKLIRIDVMGWTAPRTSVAVQ